MFSQDEAAWKLISDNDFDMQKKAFKKWLLVMNSPEILGQML